MSAVADLALVTACRDALAKTTPGPWMDTDYEPEGQWDRAVYAAHDVPVAMVWGEADALPIAGAPTVYGAALSLIEDTLNRHALVENTSRRYGYGATYCEGCLSAEHPCDDYRDHLAALHTIATALGVKTG